MKAFDIIIVSPFAEPEKGAATIRVNSFKSCFEKHGGKASVFAPERNVPDTNGVKRYNGVFQLMQWILSSNAQIVLGTSPPLTHNFFALLACRLKGIPFVLDAKEDHFVDAEPTTLAGALKKKAYLLLRKLTYTNAARMFFLTESDLVEAVSKYGVDRKGCRLVSNGSEPAKVFFSQAARTRLRKKFKLSIKSKVFVYAGGIGDEELIEFADNARSLPNSFFVFLFGRDKTKSALDAAAVIENEIKRHLGKKALILHDIPFKEIYKYFSAADYGVLPWPERFGTSIPVKVFDYMSAGLPAIIKGPSKGELKKFFMQFKPDGRYFTNWGAFSRQLPSIITTPAKRSIKNRAIIIKHFSRRKIAEQAFDEINKLVKQ